MNAEAAYYAASSKFYNLEVTCVLVELSIGWIESLYQATESIAEPTTVENQELIA